MEVNLGELNFGDVFTFKEKQYYPKSIDSRMDINNVCCREVGSSKTIWLDVDTPVEIQED